MGYRDVLFGLARTVGTFRIVGSIWVLADTGKKMIGQDDKTRSLGPTRRPANQELCEVVIKAEGGRCMLLAKAKLHSQPLVY